MGDNFYLLLWGGLFFLVIGLLMRKKDRDEIQLINRRMEEKENDLYELYQSLEEVMNEMDYLYRDRIEIEPSEINFQKKETNPVPYEEQEGKDQVKEKDTKDTIEEKNIKKEKEKMHEVRDSEMDVDDEPSKKPSANKYQRVMELKSQGYSEEEIARELMLGKGEVRLILGFNKD